MIIRDWCQPGGYKNRAGWLPQHPWPDDCEVQWGASGVVVASDGSTRRTAFFEAFPRDPSTFLRGEGATVPEAEDAAWTRFAAVRDCPGHAFERRGYRNGAGICARCGMFAVGVFPELPPDPDAPPSPLARLITGAESTTRTP